MFIYFIFNGKHVKIGISNNVKKRLNTLQVGSSNKLSILRTIEVDDDDKAKIIEDKLHYMFSKYRKNGEWFDDIVYDITNSMSDSDICHIADEDEIDKYDVILYCVESYEDYQGFHLKENKMKYIGKDLYYCNKPNSKFEGVLEKWNDSFPNYGFYTLNKKKAIHILREKILKFREKAMFEANKHFDAYLSWQKLAQHNDFYLTGVLMCK